ncbi:hypothetical protein Q1695_006135 [Nippostrongylus brasiliensis]|nr:hypothetical protein Q1695_006135 [Nippostrongylus brasiliensis]
MKAPESSSRCPSRADSNCSPVPSRHFNNHNFIKVHEGAEPDVKPSKPWLGRVLDGPVPPEKFYQGVMPPSLMQCASPVPAPVAKPPSPLPKPSKQKRNSFLNRIANESIPNDIPGYPADEYSNHVEQQRRPIQNAEQHLDEQHVSPYEQMTTIEEAPKNDQTSWYSVQDHPLPPTSPYRSAPFTERSFDTVFQTTPMEHGRQELPKVASHEDEQNAQRETDRMSELLKMRSPAPFTYAAPPPTNQPETRTNIQGSALQELTASLNEALAAFAKPPLSAEVEVPPEEPQKPVESQESLLPRQTAATHDHESLSTSSVTPSDPEMRHESQENLVRASELPASSAAPTAAQQQLEEPPTTGGGTTMYERFLAGPSQQQQHTPEMSLWYRNMFKKMHKIESPNDASVLRHRIREESPAPTISRPLTPLSFTAHAPSRHECEVTPRRAKSVGRIVEPEEMFAGGRRNASNLYALEKSRTTHFHLPSYKFAHEDPRPLVPDGPSPSGIRCLRCGLRRKDPSWSEIDAVVNSLASKPSRSIDTQRQIQSKVALRCITENLDDTARELAQFIQRLEQFWNRSRSSPQLSVCVCSGESGSMSNTAQEIAELKRISKEELLYRQKAERLAEELLEQRNRRHGYVPSASPSVLNNKDRFGGLLDEYSQKSPSPVSVHATSVRTATAIFKFDAKSPRELSLNRGDIVRIRREVDVNWLEGERNGQSGLFPRSYVQLDDEFDRCRSKAKAIYPFTARRNTELSLKMGEIVTLRREIDENWLEGTNHLGEIGIFPRNYVRLIDDRPEEKVSEHPLFSPDRPKTPKIYDKDAYSDTLNAYQPSTYFPESTSFTRDVDFDNFSNTAPVGIRPTTSENSSLSRTIPLESSRTENYPCTADKIPKGSQTYRALFPYTPMKDDEVSLEVDDIIFVVEKCDDGWFIGTVLRTGQFGTFPGNYVERH